MVDYKPTLVAELNQLGYPVFYELFIDSDTPTPCITYQQSNDEVVTEANNNVRYSRQKYIIKVWVKDDLATLAAISSLLDDKMFSLGFTRLTYNELWYDNNVVGIFTYQGLAKE